MLPRIGTIFQFILTWIIQKEAQVISLLQGISSLALQTQCFAVVLTHLSSVDICSLSLVVALGCFGLSLLIYGNSI